MLIVAIIVVVALIVALLSQRIVMAPFWARPCTGRAWKTEFPTASKQDIRDFLEIFVDGFGFPADRRLCFQPSDAVMDIYKRVKGLFSDSMELETFAMLVEDRFGLKLEECWHDRITLGQIFAKATNASRV
jgi:hypothetical protein